MKSIFYILVVSLILSGCSLASISSNHKLKSEEVIRSEYAELQANIDDLISIENENVIYEYEEIKTLVYDFDVLSANTHLGGNWTHETLLESMIQSIQEIKKND